MCETLKKTKNRGIGVAVLIFSAGVFLCAMCIGLVASVFIDLKKMRKTIDRKWYKHKIPGGLLAQTIEKL